MNYITVKDIQYLLALHEQNKKADPSAETHDISALEKLIENHEKDYQAEIIDCNDFIAVRRFTEKDFIEQTHDLITKQISDQIPTALKTKLPIYNDIEKIAIAAAEKCKHGTLYKPTDRDYNHIEGTIMQELTENYGQKYNPHLTVSIKIVYPDKTITYVSGLCNELTHEVTSIAVKKLFQTAEQTHVPRIYFGLTVIKPNQETGIMENFLYPLYHINDLTDETFRRHKAHLENIYYIY